MLNQRTAKWLFACGVWLLLGAAAVAQVPSHSNLTYQTPTPSWENAGASFADADPHSHHGILPQQPMDIEPRLDWFAPAETSAYGNGPRAHIGYFFSYERVFWSLAAPEYSPIGSLREFVPVTLPVQGGGTQVVPFPLNSFTPDGPSVDNSWIGATGAWGNRWELGYIDTNDYGWLVSVLDHVSQGQAHVSNSPALTLGDPNGILAGNVVGDPILPTRINYPTPYMWSELKMKNILQMNGVEIMRFYRAPRLHHGGYFEVLYGARWFQVNDTFSAYASGNGSLAQSFTSPFGNAFTITDNILDASTFSDRALNNLVGPQIGLRWFIQRGRWVTSVETRFMPAANFQSLRVKTNMGDQTNVNQAALNLNYGTAFHGLGVDQHNYVTTFAPMGELRVNLSFQATRAIGLKVGYTGMIVGGISRASNRLDYDNVNLIGPQPTNYNQTFFANGVNFGVEVNR